jgi:hypothetical protein
LLAVSAVVDPIARSRDPLTGGNACGMANHGHNITMTTGSGAQHTKTILGIVKCYTLDESRQDFFGGSLWLRAHTTAMITAITAPRAPPIR